jgi:hypothetical protein
VRESETTARTANLRAPSHDLILDGPEGAHRTARKKSCLGLARVVVHDGGRGYVQAFHWLTGDLGDEVEVLIKVQHRQPGEFSSRSDDQIRY